MIGIYKITSPSGKIYIGQSVNIEKRINNYRNKNCKKQIKIYNSLIKYGFENHKFEILCECEINSLNELERYYQDLYNVISKNGLNLSLTKSNDRSGYRSEETRKKIGLWHKGKKMSEEAKKKISSRNISIETRKKMSESKKGIKLTEKHKNKISISNKGNIIPNNVREINRERMKGNTRFNKKVINIETNEIFESAKTLAKTLNVDYSNFCKKITGYIKNNTPYRYLIDYENKNQLTNYIKKY